MKKIELLAPAGNEEKMEMAFHYGADAVFLGGKAFNLRGMSANFDNDSLRNAVNIAHSKNKKVYVTLNIFAHNKEIEYMPNFLKFLDEIKVDGVIVADMGVFSLVKEITPNLPIHVSTQASNTNWRSVKLWKDLGAKRVILAREIRLDEIKEIKEKVPDIEIEIFIHGAMCMAYSGRCLLSNYMNNRDANRGICSQNCRWDYKLVRENKPGEYMDIVEDENGTYIMNAKDLCTIEFIDKIIETGVDSLKIEGRMKSIYYGATVVKQYREAINLYYSGKYEYNPRWLQELETISHRLYSPGFYLGMPDENAQNYETSHSYSQTYQLVAKVIDVLGNNKYLIQVRNRIFANEELELIKPIGDSIKFTINKFIDEKNEEELDTVHPNTIAIIESEIEMNNLDMIRKKL